ncbi:MAG TPA: DUF397 domain-containing protein [Streptosporangiaceae bacterium]
MASDSGGPSRRRPRAGRRGGSRARPVAPENSSRAAKPGAAGLGLDLAALNWQRSGTEDGALEVAFVPAGAGAAGQDRQGVQRQSVQREDVQWVLLRVAGDPAGRVLVYDRVEWQSFLSGAAGGEFDFAAE